jgi:hypothetical protein
MGTVATSLQNRSREVKCTVWKVEGGGMSGFGVEGGKTNFDESWRRKNRLFPCFRISFNSAPLHL